MSESTTENRNSMDFSSLVGGIISNPDALSKMSDIISKLGLNSGNTNPPPETQKVENNTNNTTNLNEKDALSSDTFPTSHNFEVNSIISEIPDILSKISSVKGENSIIDKQQIALLLAIRPYLSEHRKELIDTFIKMDKIGAIFKNLT